MVGTLKKDMNRAEFLKKNSPIANKNDKEVSAPPLFNEVEKSSILGDTQEFEQTKQRLNLGKIAFWNNWEEKQYTYASVGLALLLVSYVGVSVSGLGSSDTSLNATLTVPSAQEEIQEDVADETDQVIQSEVVDSSVVIEDIQNDSSGEEPNITDYILESYDI